ncbi:hypothetical protein HBH98_103740 [Parastagonospora nodorum]|nr:hypothetical protein HBH51_197190 [Parastagonospora nodorum]KAH4033698.1 hypothetical protein HBI09_111790 [Parastagonospora nodorum]KAH4121761.1 hypothetical protein HBH47_097060 [Parastagonospora nodorum]KAH4204678.1 hypothetical protein HBI95_147980 [Parastagonospora nodorum]KAH4346326.1 hypothetical protein HBH98_103740 [Parastagonospora nodorum]
MDVVSLILPGLASTAAVSPLPGCGVLSDVSNLLRIGDEGLRYCSSILSIGTIVDPVYSTVTAILTTTISEVTLTDIEIVNTILSAGTSYITADEDVIVTETYTDTSVVLACPTPAGNAPVGRRGLDRLWHHPKQTSAYYPVTTPAHYGDGYGHEKPSKPRSKWTYLPSSAKHPKPSSKHPKPSSKHPWNKPSSKHHPAPSSAKGDGSSSTQYTSQSTATSSFSSVQSSSQHNIVKQYLAIECPDIFKQCRVTKQHPIIPKHPVPNSRYALAHPNFEPSLLSLSHPNTNTNIIPAPISIMFHCARRPCPSSVRYDDAHTHAGGVYYEDGHGVPV